MSDPHSIWVSQEIIDMVEKFGLDECSKKMLSGNGFPCERLKLNELCGKSTTFSGCIDCQFYRMEKERSFDEILKVAKGLIQKSTININDIKIEPIDICAKWRLS